MKVLVTGSSGLVGSQVVKDLVSENHKVYSCYNNSKPSHGIPVKLDITNHDDIKNVLTEIKPDAIIHLAAITDVDLCEAEPDLAIKINAKATKIFAEHAQNSFFVYVSTDYVFDGNKGLQKENNKPNPLGAYGLSKLEGEISLNNLASSHAIVRTSTPFGLHKTKKSFPTWVKENLEAKKEIPVLVDQFTSPTYVPNLSKMLIEVATRQIVGILHLAGATRISRYDFAQIIAEKCNLDKNLLRPVKIDEMKWKAKRPADSSLDVSFATEILNEKPQKIVQSVQMFIDELKSN